MRAAAGAAQQKPNLPPQDCRAIAAELPQAGEFWSTGDRGRAAVRRYA
jgi:hypothetical protein